MVCQDVAWKHRRTRTGWSFLNLLFFLFVMLGMVAMVAMVGCGASSAGLIPRVEAGFSLRKSTEFRIGHVDQSMEYQVMASLEWRTAGGLAEVSPIRFPEPLSLQGGCTRPSLCLWEDCMVAAELRRLEEGEYDETMVADWNACAGFVRVGTGSE